MSYGTLNEFRKKSKLNKAFKLLGEGLTLNRVADILVKQFGVSSRQALRYIHEAQSMKYPVPLVEPTIPMTIKIPRDVARKLRRFAQASNLTIGEIVAHAVFTLLPGEEYRG